MKEPLNASIVRIRTADGRVIGAGFPVDQRHILTCAHVVRQAQLYANKVFSSIFVEDDPQRQVP